MANKGFDIQGDFDAKGVTITIPYFIKGKPQLCKEEMAHNKKNASLRIHVESCTERCTSDARRMGVIVIVLHCASLLRTIFAS